MRLTRRELVGGGVLLQPMLYGLAAEKLLGQTVEAGRLFYATQRGNYTPIEIQLVPKSRAFLGKLLRIIDESIASGFLPAAPQRDSCDYCDYRPACGPNEFNRYSRKDPSRLDPLIEIRNMP